VVPEVVAALAAVGLPADPEAPQLPGLDALVAAAQSDKKAHGDVVDFVLLPQIGQALIRTLPWVHIKRALRSPRRGRHEEVE
jgi:3-dehydroquinate synthetase